MSDDFAPTPTEPQDVRERHQIVSVGRSDLPGGVYVKCRCDEHVLIPAAAYTDHVLAAVSAAAPDEREAQITEAEHERVRDAIRDRLVAHFEFIEDEECRAPDGIDCDDFDDCLWDVAGAALAALAARPAPTVSVQEALDEAARRRPDDPRLGDNVRNLRQGYREGFVAGAEWAASRPAPVFCSGGITDTEAHRAVCELHAALGRPPAPARPAPTVALTPEWIAAHERDHIDAYEEVDGTCVSVAHLRGALGLTVADEGRAEA